MSNSPFPDLRTAAYRVFVAMLNILTLENRLLALSQLLKSSVTIGIRIGVIMVLKNILHNHIFCLNTPFEVNSEFPHVNKFSLAAFFILHV